MLVTGLTYIAKRSNDPTEWRRALLKIEDRCEDIAETLRTFMAFSSRREDDLTMSFSAAEMLAQATRLLRPLALDAGASIETNDVEDAPLQGDERMALQAVVNLGSNAIRASCQDTGRVRIRGMRLDEDTYRIDVEDNGPGIPEPLRHRLFRPFVSGNPGKGGRGMGLFVVRQTVRCLGGLIRAESSTSGTTFSVELPLIGAPSGAQGGC